MAELLTKKEVDRRSKLSYNLKLCDSVSERPAKSPGEALEIIEDKSCEILVTQPDICGAGEKPDKTDLLKLVQ